MIKKLITVPLILNVTFSSSFLILEMFPFSSLD